MRVFPKNEDVRKNMKHMPSGKTLGDDLVSGAEWPDDNFTRRRIRDGDLSISPAVEQTERTEPAEQQVSRRGARNESRTEATEPNIKPTATHKTE